MRTGTELLALGATACFIASVLVLVRTHLLPTGRDPIRDAVSDYGVGAYHRYYRAMVLLLGLGAMLLGVALARDGRAGFLGLAFLGAYSAARLAIAFFMTDVRDQPMTTAGRMHVVLAAIAFTSIAFASVDVTGALDGWAGWSGTVADVLRFEARAVAAAAVLTLGCFLVAAARDRAFGLVERLLYITSLAWLLSTSIHLAVLAGGG